MDAMTCEKCGDELFKDKVYRFGRIIGVMGRCSRWAAGVVALLGVLVFIVAAVFTQRARTAIHKDHAARLQKADLPESVIQDFDKNDRVDSIEGLTPEEMARLEEVQRRIQKRRLVAAGAVATYLVFGGTCIAVAFGLGLVGWIAGLRRKVIRCFNCGFYFDTL